MKLSQKEQGITPDDIKYLDLLHLKIPTYYIVVQN